MRKVIVCLLIVVFMLPVTVMASSYRHEVEITLDGEWKLDSNTRTPTASVDLALEGKGRAQIKSTFFEQESLADWWRLF